MISDNPLNNGEKSVLQRLDALESQDAIRRLKAEYMQACDDKRGRAVADLFWPDGIWEGVGQDSNNKATGHAAIADMFEASPRRLTFTTHYLMNESIQVNGDQGRGFWKILEPCTFRDQMALWMGGRYDNLFERRNGVWRFKHLKLYVEFRTPYEAGWLKERFATLDNKK